MVSKPDKIILQNSWGEVLVLESFVPGYFMSHLIANMDSLGIPVELRSEEELANIDLKRELEFIIQCIHDDSVLPHFVRSLERKTGYICGESVRFDLFWIALIDTLKIITPWYFNCKTESAWMSMFNSLQSLKQS